MTLHEDISEAEAIDGGRHVAGDAMSDVELVLAESSSGLDNGHVLPAQGEDVDFGEDKSLGRLEVARQPVDADVEQLTLSGLRNVVERYSTDVVRIADTHDAELAEDHPLDDPSTLEGIELDEWLKEHTYPFAGRLAVDLKNKIREQVEQIEAAGEKVDFGEVTLDVGSRDGRYAGVIRSLGPKRVIAIDPSGDEVKKGMDSGFIYPGEAFAGTALEYGVKMAVNEIPKYDSLFILNINPSLSKNREFIDTVLDMVKPGGWVVFSAIEEQTYHNWCNAVSWPHKLTVPMRIDKRQSYDYEEPEFEMELTEELLDSDDSFSNERRGRYDGYPNGYLVIFRRTYEL